MKKIIKSTSIKGVISTS